MKINSLWTLPLYFYLGIFLLQTSFIQAETRAYEMNLSKEAVQIEIPFEKQEDPKECGLAVLKMISSFYDQKLNQAQVDWVRINSTAGEGVMASELVTVLRAAGFETALYQGTLNKDLTGLLRQLDKHRPVIVMITSKDGKSSHYDIVTGYDPVKHFLLLMDPATGPVTALYKDFEPAWRRANNFSLLAVPKKILEKTPTPTH